MKPVVMGVVLGVGAVILSKTKNQEKIKKAFNKAKDFVHKYAEKTNDEIDEGKATIKKVTKTVKMKVRKI